MKNKTLDQSYQKI